MNISIRKAVKTDHPVLESLRVEAFAPIFASFRRILGDEIYELAQKKEDEDQSQHLTLMLTQDSIWDLYVAEIRGQIVGFVSIKLCLESSVGEIGLNAVKPSESNRGIGTKMYEFAIDQMKDAGMRVATVATGGDNSHAPARRAYQKSGFNVQVPSVWLCRTL